MPLTPDCFESTSLDSVVKEVAWSEGSCGSLWSCILQDPAEYKEEPQLGGKTAQNTMKLHRGFTVHSQSVLEAIWLKSVFVFGCH